MKNISLPAQNRHQKILVLLRASPLAKPGAKSPFCPGDPGARQTRAEGGEARGDLTRNPGEYPKRGNRHRRRKTLRERGKAGRVVIAPELRFSFLSCSRYRADGILRVFDRGPSKSQEETPLRGRRRRAGRGGQVTGLYRRPLSRPEDRVPLRYRWGSGPAIPLVRPQKRSPRPDVARSSRLVPDPWP